MRPMRPTRASLAMATLIAIGCREAPEPPAADRSAQAPAASAPSPAPSRAPAEAAATPPSAASVARPAPPEPEPGLPVPKKLIDKPPATWAVRDAAWKGPLDPGRDRAWLERLAAAPIVDLVRNKGGATITLRIRFADAGRAAFKPEQRHSASNHRAEIAAYHLDRVLGLGRTAPVVGRSIAADRVRRWLEHAQVDPKFLERFERDVVVRDGRIHGCAIAWHDKRLTRAEPPRDWARALLDADAGSLPAERALEWSDMVVFDYLLDNADRWSGGNILALGDGGPLIFLDNAAGLMRRGIAEPERTALGPVCRFRASTVASLRAGAGRLGARLERSLSADPLAPVLSEAQLRAIDARAEKLLSHVDRCVEQHGREAALSP